MPPSGSMSRVLGYNCRKVDRDTAAVVALRNMDGPGEAGMKETFSRFERLNISTQNPVFHMAVNPGEGESWDDSRICDYVDEVMEGLGYGRQPYVIFRHSDIARTHYHVVSIRVDGRGRKIRDSFENDRCRALAMKLEKKYGYRLGGGNTQRKNRFGILQFDPSQGDSLSQMRSLYEHALQYRFTNFEQFVMILRVHGLEVKQRTGRRTELFLQGLDSWGRPSTRMVDEKSLGMPLYELYSRRAIDSVSCMDEWMGNRGRVIARSIGPLEDSRSQKEFRKFLRFSRIDFRFRRNGDSHRITGADFVDHRTMCAFSLADLGKELNVDMLREADGKRWEHEEQEQDPAVGLGDLLAGLSAGSSKSREKDMKDDPRKRKGRRI